MHTRQTNIDADALAEGQNGRPAFCEDEHLYFLDDLRESAVTNMFGAVPYLQEEFDMLTSEQASAVLGYWMESYGNEDR